MTLQEKMDLVLGELTWHEEPVSIDEVAEKLALPRMEVERLIQLLVRDGVAYSPRIGYWRAGG